jgi:hypothetical protein
MIVWRGWGFAVALIVLVACIVANLLANTLGGKGYFEAHAWPLASALIIAGPLIWLTDILLSRGPSRVLVDEKTGERVALAKKHDFFFIPMRWWGAVVAVIGIVLLVTRHAPGSGLL